MESTLLAPGITRPGLMSGDSERLPVVPSENVAKFADAAGTRNVSTLNSNAVALKPRQQDDTENRALLGILLAKLEGVTFDEVALLLNVPKEKLEGIMHGRPIPPRRAQRWSELANILDDLHGVIRPQATGRWMRTAIRDLGGKTPLDVIGGTTKGGVLRVRAVTKSYSDPSFA